MEIGNKQKQEPQHSMNNKPAIDNAHSTWRSGVIVIAIGRRSLLLQFNVIIIKIIRFTVSRYSVGVFLLSRLD